MYILLILLSFILPVTLLIIGLIFYKFSPQKINSFSGYRTTRSMKNIETWNEANKHSSKLMIKFSFSILLLTTFGVFLADKSYKMIVAVILVSTIVSVIFILITIILTEKHLINMFGE